MLQTNTVILYKCQKNRQIIFNFACAFFLTIYSDQITTIKIITMML